MNRFRIFLLACLSLVVAAEGRAAARNKSSSGSSKPAGSYRGVIVVDAASGNTLLEENADVVSPPASMTKLMTFAVLWDKIQSGAIGLETPIKIDESDAHIGGTQVYLDPRETFPVEELIYAMMIQSANDAAHALARASAGSVPGFVELMNAKAKELGMTHTIFRTPNGLTSKRQKLDEGDLTTPRDFALLCRHLVTKTDVLKYTSVKERDFGTGRAKGPQHMENHNKLMSRVAGMDGLKTGYTENAGYCLSATASRNGRRVIVVIMGCYGPKGHEIDLGRSRDQYAVQFLERGFTALPPAPVSPSNPVAPALVSPSSSAGKPPASAVSPIRPADTPEKAPDAAPAVKFPPPPPKK
jgi:D-alanyl-D-alanine carboxypeptidase (penicillin-binding protein 5/6)